MSSNIGNSFRYWIFVSFGIGFITFMPIHANPKDINQTSPLATQILDQKKIHQIYTDGDFDLVVASIDSFTQKHKTYSLSDSVFIAKHLAVIYTANPATREKGKNYMFRLLTLIPSAKIVDMFVSDEIDHIFEKVKEEYIVRRQLLGLETPNHLESNLYATDKMTMKDHEPEKSRLKKSVTGNTKKRNTHTLYWVAGGATLIAITGTAAYFLMPNKTADKSYDLP